VTRRALLVSLIFMVVLSVVAVGASAATRSSPTLGLDLQGGFSVVLEAREVDGVLPSEDAVEKAKDIIRQRVDGLGVAEPDITRQGRTVIVQLPGVRDRERAEELVGCTAQLEFRPVLSAAPDVGALDGVDPEELDLGDLEGVEPGTGQPDDVESGDGGDPDGVEPADQAPTTETGDDAGDDGAEDGQGMVGAAPGEVALPAQFVPTTTAPPETVPEETVPEETAPDETAPDETAPDETAPEDTTPDETLPDEAPAETPTDEASASCIAADDDRFEPVGPGEEGQFPADEGELVYTLGPVGFTGESLSSADATLGEFGEWQVNVDTNAADQAQANEAFNACFQSLPTCPAQGDTSQGGGGAIAIVLDGVVLSAPTVNAANLASDTFIITGQFGEDEAKDLALVLRYGSLPVEFEQAALQQVSATLGQDSLQAGLIAGLIGIALLALYMVLYYRGFGVVVVTSLGVWAALMYGLINLLSATQGLALTLAGITGIIVSVGTTVDTYVVVFERVKDEVRSGRSLRTATERGYHRGIRTVLTANAAAFIGAFLLWYLTVGPVRGFAYFLGLSVILDLVVAVLFTRPMVLLLSRSPRFANARFFGAATATGSTDPAPAVAPS
jgi:preprotein translocase subunit SecD